MPTQTAVSHLTPPGSSSSTACVLTRCTWKAATQARTLTASPETSIMTTEMAPASWVMLVSLGAFHGINPGMGWLFAVALGMQERRRGAVLRALLPLGAGHALAVAGADGVALSIGADVPLRDLRW